MPKYDQFQIYCLIKNIYVPLDQSDWPTSGEMGHHGDSSISQPGSFNPYLEGMSYPGQAYGLYPHHFSKLRGPHDLNGAYGDYPTKPQQAVPTYKWMQVKRNVPKPGKTNSWPKVKSLNRNENKSENNISGEKVHFRYNKSTFIGTVWVQPYLPSNEEL